MAHVKQVDRHSLGYHFTVTSRDDIQLAHLRKQITAHNVYIRKFVRKYKVVPFSKLQVVKLQARGPRTAPSIADGHHPRYYDQSLPLRHGTSFDVYVYNSSMNYELRAEIASL